MAYNSTSCYWNSERSKIQEIAKGFLGNAALPLTPEAMEPYLDNKVSVL